MLDSAVINNETSASALIRARALHIPARQDMLKRSPSVQSFWQGNHSLLQSAWLEWEQNETVGLTFPSVLLLDEKLVTAVQRSGKTQKNKTNLMRFYTKHPQGCFSFNYLIQSVWLNLAVILMR